VSPRLNLYSAALPTSDTDPVAVIGASGALGFGVAVRLVQAGVPVAIGSRDAERARQTVERAQAAIPGSICTPHDNAGAVRAASVVILSVPFRNQSETLTNLKEALRPGQLLIDATVPLTAAQQAQEMVPAGVRVVSALHTLSATSLSELQHPLQQDVLLCGDSRADKRDAAELLERIEGLRCVDCGRLEMARITESLTALLISVNARYKVHAGVRLTGLPDRLER